MRDRQSSLTTRVSVSTGGGEADGASTKVVIRGNGNIVAFTSGATNLVAGDTNGTDDVFARYLNADLTVRVSVRFNEGEAHGASDVQGIGESSDAVVFTSDAADMTDNDANGLTDLFVRRLASETTARVTLASWGMSSRSDISGDGRFVAFESSSNRLIRGDYNGQSDIFVRDNATGTVERVSVASDESESDDESLMPSISDDGRYVAFVSAAGLVPEDAGGHYDVYVRDRWSGDTLLVTRGLGGISPACSREVVRA